jgi:hypothetical protein
LFLCSFKNVHWTFLFGHFYAAEKCEKINVLLSALWCRRFFVSFCIIYYHFSICEWGQKILCNCQTKYGFAILAIKSLLKILKILKKHIIGHKCPMDIFKGSMNFTKNAHFNHHSLPHHLWCGIYKPQNPLFFKFQKTLKNKTSLIKCKMDIFNF